MIYEARQSPKLNYALAGACVLLSLIGFAAAGVIPNNSGYYPLVGWPIVGACLGAAFIFVRRASSRKVEARIDGRGIYAPAFSPEPVPWDRIRSILPLRIGVQRIVRFELGEGAPNAAENPVMRAAGAVDRGLGFGDFGINATYLNPGFDALLAAVHHYRPDLLDGSGRL
jgi:hypothetical protein